MRKALRLGCLASLRVAGLLNLCEFRLNLDMFMKRHTVPKEITERPLRKLTRGVAASPNEQHSHGNLLRVR